MGNTKIIKISSILLALLITVGAGSFAETVRANDINIGNEGNGQTIEEVSDNTEEQYPTRQHTGGMAANTKVNLPEEPFVIKGSNEVENNELYAIFENYVDNELFAGSDMDNISMIETYKNGDVVLHYVDGSLFKIDAKELIKDVERGELKTIKVDFIDSNILFTENRVEIVATEFITRPVGYLITAADVPLPDGYKRTKGVHYYYLGEYVTDESDKSETDNQIYEIQVYKENELEKVRMTFSYGTSDVSHLIVEDKVFDRGTVITPEILNFSSAEYPNYEIDLVNFKHDVVVGLADTFQYVPLKLKDGIVINGWRRDRFGDVRYYVNGTPLTGMTKTNTETIYLFDAEGNRQYGWHNLNGKHYYFSPEHEGGMITGLRTVGKSTYLLTRDGKMKGWRNLNGRHYYFGSKNGEMLTGKRKIGQTTYLLTSEGKKYGWHRLNGKDYYFSPEHGGGMITGFRQIGKTRYEFHPDGHKLRIVR